MIGLWQLQRRSAAVAVKTCGWRSTQGAQSHIVSAAVGASAFQVLKTLPKDESTKQARRPIRPYDATQVRRSGLRQRSGHRDKVVCGGDNLEIQ